MSPVPVLRTPGAVLTSVFDGLTVASGQQRVLRLLGAATVLGYAALVPAAGAAWHPTLTAVLVLVGVLAVLLPESNAPLVWLLLAVALWMGTVPETLSGWTLLAALDLSALHVLCLLCGYAPPALPLSGSLLRSWAGRAAVLGSVTALVWLAARVAGGLDLPASALALAAALTLVTAWAAYLLPRLTTRDGAAPAADPSGPAGRSGGPGASS